MAKASKKRDCPALGHSISSAECGQNRHRRYACPAGCPFNPFSPGEYDQFLEIETRLDDKIIARMPRDFPIPVPILPDGDRPTLTSYADASQARALWKLFCEKDPSGRTWAQRQLDEGFAALKNDERVMLEGKLKTRATLIEIRRIVDDRSVRVLDLLDRDGPAFTVVDRSVAARSARFEVYLAWIYPTPHYDRFTGAFVDLPEHPEMDPVGLLQEISKFHGGPKEPEGLGEWLAENFILVSETVLAFSVERRKKMLAGIDLIDGKVSYDLNAPFTTCRQRLDDSPHVEKAKIEEAEWEEGFEEVRVWLAMDRPNPDAEEPAFQDVLGHILLDQDEWRLEATSASRMKRMRAEFEKWMGGLVAFESEETEDTAARMAMSYASGNPKLVPPRLLELPGEAVELKVTKVTRPSESEGDPEAVIANTMKSWPDLSVPALNGLTPREAVEDPALRPRVIALVKSQARGIDKRNLEKGRHDDANFLMTELGLTEIDEPPPPPRTFRVAAAEPTLPTFDSDWDEDFEGPDNVVDFEGDLFSDPSDKPAGDITLPEILSTSVDHVLGFDEAEKRVAAALDYVVKAQDSNLKAGDSVVKLIEILFNITEEILDPDGFNYLASLVALGTIALLPPGSRMPPVSSKRLESTIAATLSLMNDDSCADLGSLFAKLKLEWRQPELVMHLFGAAISIRKDQSEKERLSYEAATMALLVLAAVIDEVDRALRG